jgi:hypothetical protein
MPCHGQKNEFLHRISTRMDVCIVCGIEQYRQNFARYYLIGSFRLNHKGKMP